MNKDRAEPVFDKALAHRFLERKLQVYRYRLVPAAAWMRRAAVAVILHPRDGEIGVLFIRRSQNPSDPWSGHMAFPGGRREPQDANARETAERETREEIGVDLPQSARCMGRMSDMLATARGRHLPLVITPWVYRVDTPPDLEPNQEVDDIIWVPLSYFQDADNREFFDYEVAGFRLHLPCYNYRGCTIWGLTLKMLDELLDIHVRAQAAADEEYLRGVMHSARG